MAEIRDSERDRAVRELTRHCGEGRLTLDELEDRITEVYAATTEAELRLAFRELPSFRLEPAPPAAEDRPRPRAAIPAPPVRTTHPSGRARTPAARGCGVGGVVSGPPIFLIAIVTILFVTAHFFWAILLLCVALPKRMQRAYART